MSVVNSIHFPQAVDEQLPGYHHPTPEKKLLFVYCFLRKAQWLCG